MEIIINMWGKDRSLKFVRRTYLCNGNLSIEVMNYDEEYEFWEPWCSLTVNLDLILESNRAFLDTNNCSREIIEWLFKNRYVTKIGERRSGFCVYPLVEFSEEFMETIVAEEDE